MASAAHAAEALERADDKSQMSAQEATNAPEKDNDETSMSAEEIDAAVLAARIPLLKQSATDLALLEIADAVGEAIAGFDGSLRELEALTGMDKAHLSKLANGHQMATVGSLARIALALGKSLKITIR